MLTDASQIEVIRSHQKDDYYLVHLRRRVNDVAHSILGAHGWIKWSKEIVLAADVGYFTLTTISGLQTLGEEYVNIIQVDGNKTRIPSTRRRLFLVLLHVISPYLLEKLLDNLVKRLERNDFGFLPNYNEILLKAVRFVKKNIVIFHRCHLAVFYLYGVFYQISKRLTGIHYVRVRSPNKQALPNFRVLGYISVIQLGFTLCQSLLGYWAERNRKKSSSINKLCPSPSPTLSTAPNAAQKCSLCLERRKSTTLTTCGHLFCWTCIHEWCATQAVCPLCRQKILPQKLVLLRNYDNG